MGTPHIPFQNSIQNHQGPIVEDIPRIGAVMWVLLSAFLIPPVLITLFGNLSGGFPHQTMWILLLGIPIPLILFLFPKKYVLDNKQLLIIGHIYKMRIAREEILWAKPIETSNALFCIGSIFCSSPQKAIEIKRRRGWNVIISPTDPTLFVNILNKNQAADSPSNLRED
jgi:hypothetical protein